MDNTDQIINLTNNLVVFAKQVFQLAMEQYDADFESGSRSNSRSQLLGEIGSFALDIAQKCKQINSNASLLKEIPMNPTDASDPDKRLDWQIWLLPQDNAVWQVEGGRTDRII